METDEPARLRGRGGGDLERERERESSGRRFIGSGSGESGFGECERPRASTIAACASWMDECVMEMM